MGVHVVAICDCCEKNQILAPLSVRGGLKDILTVWISVGVKMSDTYTQDHLFCERCGAALGLFMPCPGEGHEVIRKGGDVDGCGVCSPRWNMVPARPVPLITKDDVTALYNKLNAPPPPPITDLHDDDGDDDQTGNIYPLEEDYFTTTQLT